MAGVKGMKGGGGRRPGSGRKMAGQSKKVQVTITITQQEREDLDFLKSKAVDTNKMLGREIRRLATAFDLAELGIE